MASITQRGNKYLIRISLNKDKNGKRKYYSVTYTPKSEKKRDIKKEVEKYALDLESTMKNYSLADGGKKRFVNFVEEWKEDYASDPENMTESLRDSYYDLLERKVVDRIGHLPMCDIKAEHISAIYASMKKDGLSSGTRKRVQSAIRSVFKYAKEDLHIISSDPSLECSIKKAKTDKSKIYQVFNKDQYNAFIDWIRATETLNNQWISFFSMALYGGFRRGELLALTWEDLDFDNMEVRISKSIAKKKNQNYVKGSSERKEILFVKDSPKTDSGNRCVDLPDFVFQDLQIWKDQQKDLSEKLGSKWQGSRGEDFDKNFVFIDIKTGGMMNQTTPTHKIRTSITSYNAEHPDSPLPVLSLHDLRHTHATDLIYRGVPLTQIAQRLGHKNIYVTSTIYAHYLERDTSDRSISRLYEKEKTDKQDQ